ncbi:hypothetical protein [Hypericibacter sp.]|uniref:hypothetical protein n=1 Tax=Hypericibacter sp. TaxID=2705401 RepID=UPI003D6C7338
MVRNGGILSLAVGGVNRGWLVLSMFAAKSRCALIVANPGRAPGGPKAAALDGLCQTG